MHQSLSKRLGFTDGWLGVMTADIMELDSVIVEVVQDSQTEFIALTVVRLGNTTTGNNKINKFISNNASNYVITCASRIYGNQSFPVLLV